MKVRKVRYAAVAALVCASSAAMILPARAGLTVVEKAGDKPATPPQPVIEEGTRLRAENDRLSGEVARLNGELQRVEAELASSRQGAEVCAARLITNNQTLSDARAKLAETGSATVRVKFDFGKTTFTPGKDIAETLVEVGKAATRVQVSGHTDNQGSAEVNSQVGLSRAQAAKKYLVAQGVPDGKIATSSAGATAPVASNATADGRAQNRRVEVEFVR